MAGKGRKAKDGQKVYLNPYKERPTHGVLIEEKEEGKSKSKKRKRDEPENLVDTLGRSWFTEGRGAREKRKIGNKELKMLRLAFDMGSDAPLEGPKREIMVDLFEKAMKTQEDKKQGKVLTLSESAFFTPMPGKPGMDDRSCYYISGPPKVGKSVLCARIIENFDKTHKGYRKFLISAATDDPAFEKLGLEQIPLDESLVTDPIKLESLKQSLIVMDDIDAVGSKPLKQALLKLREQIVNDGRKSDITAIFTSHKIRQWRESSACLSGCSDIVIFPCSPDKRDFKLFLKDYCDMTPEMIERIATLPSRWALIHRYAPYQYVLSEHQCFVL